MDDPQPRIAVAGRVGASLLAYTTCQLDPSPTLLYAMSAAGALLILWEAITYGAKLARHIRARSQQRRATTIVRE